MNVLDITSPPNVSTFVPNQDKIWPKVKLTCQTGDKLLSSPTVDDDAAW